MIRPYLFSPAETLDLRRLREIRRDKGLTLAAVGQGMGLSGGRYGGLERGETHMRLYQFRQVCILLDLNPLEVCELLRLPVINRLDARNFRAACRRMGTTPAQALADFLKTFIRLSREGAD